MAIAIDTSTGRMRRLARDVWRWLVDLPDEVSRTVPWSVVCVAAVGVATLLARLPGIIYTGMFDRDESFLAVTGDMWRHGGTLYVDVIDRKPPVVPVAYGIVRMFTEDMRGVRAVLAVAIALSGLAVVGIVRRLSGSRRAALYAGVLSVLGTAWFLPHDAQAANFELWGLPFASAAILAVLVARSRTDERSRWMWLALAGAAVAVAAQCKQPYVVVALPVAFEALRRPREFARIVAPIVGFVAATAPFVWVFGGAAMWRWVWADNGDYVNGGLALGRAAAVGLGLTAVFALLHLPMLYGLWAWARRRVIVDPVIALWLIGSMLVIPIGWRFFGHYYQQLVPPLAVITGCALVRAGRLVRVAVVACALALTGSMVALAFAHRPDLSNFTTLGRYVQSITTEDQHIVVWGALPDVYVASQRLPAGVFLHDGYLTGNWASRAEPLEPTAMTRPPYDERWRMFLADFDRQRPEVVIDAARPGTDWAPYSPSKYPLGARLAQCYRQVAVVDGLPVWRLDHTMCP